MFADADSFWKPPTVYDALSVLGLALGIASIWYAWFLARKQLRADFRKAADEAVDRVALLVLGNDVADAVRFLREADQALTEKGWLRGTLRLEDASAALSRLISNPRLTGSEREQLAKRLKGIRTLHTFCREHALSKAAKDHLPPKRLAVLAQVVTELEQIRGRLLTGSILTLPTGGDDGDDAGDGGGQVDGTDKG